MIIYDLSCDHQHRFEGWFQNPGDFESQLERHLVRCPSCDSSTVRRVPSAVAIGGHHSEPAPRESGSEPRPAAAATAVMPAGSHALDLYRQLVSALMVASEDVGRDFAEEARRIHYNEAPERAIRGQTTQEEYEALQDEGITIMRLPRVKEDDLN